MCNLIQQIFLQIEDYYDLIGGVKNEKSKHIILRNKIQIIFRSKLLN